MKRFRKILQNEELWHIKLRTAVVVETTTPVKEVIAQLKRQRRGCAIIQKGNDIIGIFTERDFLKRVLGPGIPLETPISAVMTKNPAVLKPNSSLASAIKLMSEHAFRHVPLVDDKKQIRGFVSVRDIVDYLAEHFPYDVYSLPPDPNQIQRTPEGA